jgi:plastocyanin
MRFSLATLAAITAATSASAATWNVTVGGSAGLVYTPNQINASVGDVVLFTFGTKNHTATQSTFTAPCQKMAGGVDSGFQPVAANATQVPQFSITVNVSTPIWFYCQQTGHCEEGMVFAINPTANKSFATFQATAKASSADGTPPTSNSTSASGSSGSSTTTGTAAAASASKKSGALSNSVRGGGLLAAVGLAAGVLL